MKLKHIKLLLMLFLVIFFGGCQTSKYIIETDPNTITIATFNTEWLGDGIDDTKPRFNYEYENIAKILYMTNADIIALQEVENDKAIEKITNYLVGYNFYVLNGTGKQNCAILYNHNLDIRILGNYEPINVKPGRTRPGLIAYVKKGNFDFILMNIHLKSTSSYDNTDQLREESYLLRQNQATAISNWVDSLENHSKEKDIIILGDFNDNPLRLSHPTLTPLIKNKYLSFLTANLKSCKNPKWDNIDNFVVTKSVLDRVIYTSIKQINTYQMLKKKEAESISDHCPVIISFDITKPDND
jgi:endonuclease/exonuclease/phosphatase family metal-dependent hydrolase